MNELLAIKWISIFSPIRLSPHQQTFTARPYAFVVHPFQYYITKSLSKIPERMMSKCRVALLAGFVSKSTMANLCKFSISIGSKNFRFLFAKIKWIKLLDEEMIDGKCSIVSSWTHCWWCDGFGRVLLSSFCRDPKKISHRLSMVMWFEANKPLEYIRNKYRLKHCFH